MNQMTRVYNVMTLCVSSNVKWLQSGGLADIFLVDGVVYKISRRGAEKREFSVVKYLIEQYRQGVSMPHVVTYYGYGYGNKEEIIYLYEKCGLRGIHLTKIKEIYFTESKIPFVCMEYVLGLDGVAMTNDDMCTYHSRGILNSY